MTITGFEGAFSGLEECFIKIIINLTFGLVSRRNKPNLIKKI